jgi:hypothetical protein
LLKRVKQVSRRSRKVKQESPPVMVSIAHDTWLVRKFDVWNRVQFTSFPKSYSNSYYSLPVTAFDVLHGARLTRAQAVEHYGRPLIAVKVRPATRTEVRRFVEPLKAPNRV